MKWTILTLLLLVKTVNVSAATLHTNKPISLEVNPSQDVALPISKPGYYRGYLRSKTDLDNVAIYNSQGVQVKHLIRSTTKETEIFWLVESADTYVVKFDGVQHPKLAIEFFLKPLALKKNQYLSPEAAIISPLIKETASQLSRGNLNAESEFWSKIALAGTPLVEYEKDNKAIVTFLFNGKANNVRVLGSPYGGHSHLSQLNESSIWFRSFQIPSDSRLSYRIAPNVPQLEQDKNREQRKAVLATAQPDPLNPNPLFGQGDNLFSAASTLTLADAPSDSVTTDSGSPKGQVSHHVYQSPNSELARRYSLYQPNGVYVLDSDAPLLFLFDGDATWTKFLPRQF
ncbi:enterochelin esterase domain-containing protein [Vibrio sonorensis]|uniref:enterochelin esterase domain-containing protein n=1 Tax=Vibrio sonorensis TaxID=1004316 RepID=UPI0008D9D526|nr:enterochelin esterase domain-containing protein [Vibrio sonorensis]